MHNSFGSANGNKNSSLQKKASDDASKEEKNEGANENTTANTSTAPGPNTSAATPSQSATKGRFFGMSKVN